MSIRQGTTQRGSPNRTHAQAQQSACLRLVYGPAPTVLHEIELEPDDDLFLIGRDVPPPGLSVPDPRMSRLHARVTWDPRENVFRFGDAGSSNGIFHNGARAQGGLLAHGDVLRMGDTLFVFERTSPMRTLQEQLVRMANSHLTLLFVGESGTGKEVLAKRVHELSGRKGQFVPVNCAALPRDLIASELFGHARGAFSSATQSRAGLFAAAQDGTLFLDEIGDLPLEQQPALLRVLQEKTVRPIGSDREVAISARVLAATHVALEHEMEQGRFRRDLFARLAQCVVTVPPLRERRGEIIELAQTIAVRARRPLELTADAAEALLLWHWPFNVRELQGVVERFSAMAAPESPLDWAYLAEDSPNLVSFRAQRPEIPSIALDQRERLRRLLIQENGNISAVARALGKQRAQVYRWLKAHGLSRQVSAAAKANGKHRSS
jgi:transcriptional regulator with GAF, ATPase, and Fis domain